MKKYLPAIAVTLLVLVIACTKDFNLLTEPPPVTVAPTPVGTAIGPAVEKMIGAAGGTLASEDGEVELIVPAGAVTGNTNFSIQPITNFCPGGKAVYRFSPSGQAFLVPVIIKFHYTDESIEGSLPELLGIAFQDTSGVWYGIPSANIDTLKKTIAVNARHFTDWGFLEALRIIPVGISSVKITENLDLQIVGRQPQPVRRFTGNSSPSADDDDLPPLPPNVPFMAEWYVNNIKDGNAAIGKLTTSPGTASSVFTAPSKSPLPSTVTIKAILSNYTWRVKIDNNWVSFNKVILLKRIKITGGEYHFAGHYEMTLKDGCSFPGQVQTDYVDFDLDVVDNAVTLSNIVNQPIPTVNPAVVQSGNCTITATPGTNGYINITKAVGNMEIFDPNEEGKLVLSFTSSGAHTNNCKLVCNPLTTTSITPSSLIPEALLTGTFLLRDTVLEDGDKTFGVFWRLTPKPR
jgi:hypothetical protein